MKRSPLPPRKTPLTSSTPLSRTSPPPRTTPLLRSPRKPVGSRSKPLSSARPKQGAEERRARKLVRARSGGRCERCGRAPATNWHHRIAKGRGGPWCPSNGLDLCGSGTTGCHGEVTASPSLAYERGWSVRTNHIPADVPVWLAGRGFTYLRADGSTSTERSAA